MSNKVTLHQWVLGYWEFYDQQYSVKYQALEAEEKPNTYETTNHFANYNKTIKKDSLDTVMTDSYRSFYVSLNNDEDVALEKLLDFEIRKLNEKIGWLGGQKQTVSEQIEKLQRKELEYKK